MHLTELDLYWKCLHGNATLMETSQSVFFSAKIKKKHKLKGPPFKLR